MMWQKLTEEKINKARRKITRTQKCQATVVGIIFGVISLLFWSKGSAAKHSSPFVSWQEMPARISYALTIGLAIGGLYYYRLIRKQKMVICPKCEAAKYQDNVIRCSCGGDFVDMVTVKWVD